MPPLTSVDVNDLLQTAEDIASYRERRARMVKQALSSLYSLRITNELFRREVNAGNGVSYGHCLSVKYLL